MLTPLPKRRCPEETRPNTPGVTLLSRQELASDKDLHFATDDRVIITSEAIMDDDVLTRMDDAKRTEVVGQFKDKVAFRQAAGRDVS